MRFYFILNYLIPSSTCVKVLASHSIRQIGRERRLVSCVGEKAEFEPRTLGTEAERADHCADHCATHPGSILFALIDTLGALSVSH